MRRTKLRAENRIDSIEIPVTDPARVREFFAALFGWEFQDWGPDYISFTDGRLEGGIRRADRAAPATGVLLVFYSEDLARDKDRITKLGGNISQDIYGFPGGRRFHFTDPTGTEYAMWTATETE
jgi:predicted enzyme related to lactoylglutathione lyase